MNNEATTMSGMGPSADGKGWVNLNHTCSCGERLPLPEWADKFCPNCGRRQPGPEMKKAEQAAEEAKLKTCPKPDCRHVNNKDANYCIMCGTKLPVQDSIVKGT